MVEVARPNATATNVEQRFYSVATEDKRRAVLKLLKERSITQALIFVNSKLGCARLARSFERDGLRTNALHGDKSQDERLKALDAFKAGSVDVLVATDVAARGLDIVDLPAVFNFDCVNARTCHHSPDRGRRIGLGRALVSRETPACSDIEKLIKKRSRSSARARRRAAAAPIPRTCGSRSRRRAVLPRAAAGTRPVGSSTARVERSVFRQALRTGRIRCGAGLGAQDAGRAARYLAEHQAEAQSRCAVWCQGPGRGRILKTVAV